MIHYSRVVQGILKYIQNEMAGKLAGSWKAWAMNIMAGMAASKAEPLIRELSANSVVKALGLIDGENVNVDALMGELRKQAKDSTATINIPMIGVYTIGIADVDALDRYIRG